MKVIVQLNLSDRTLLLGETCSNIIPQYITAGSLIIKVKGISYSKPPFISLETEPIFINLTDKEVFEFTEK